MSRSGTSCRFWFQRSKRASEQQWGSLKYHLDGSLSRHTGWIFWWKFVLLFAIAALVCFYGVGIIATNSTFSPIFVRYFFWVAIFWSLISSLLLSWVVIAFGSSTRDSVGAFLSAIAIWLVIIQVSTSCFKHLESFSSLCFTDWTNATQWSKCSSCCEQLD